MQIADQVLFKGYSGNPQEYEALLAPGDACVVEEVDGDTAVVVRTLTSAGQMGVREWAFPEELMRIDPSKPEETAKAQVVLRTMAKANTKKYTDLRDRVAYMFVTGAHPTNLRPPATNALNVLSAWAARSGHFGPHVIDRSAVHTLRLREHSLVVEAQRLMSEGWQLVVSLGPNKRRSYQYLFFARGDDRLTLHVEGWTRSGWLQDWPKRSTRRLN